MRLNQYQQDALRTWSTDQSYREMQTNAVLGLNGEAGEAADLLKKYLFQGHRLDKDRMIKELGDVLYYVAVAANAFGYDLESVAQMNIDKLQKRYPEGFTTERSVNRDQ